MDELLQYLKEHGIQAELQRHHAQDVFDRLRKTRVSLDMLEKLYPEQQLIATGPFGSISVIKAQVSFNQYEIYSLSGHLFSDIRRYKTVEDCGKTIVSLLNTGTFAEDAVRAFDVFTDCIFANPDGSVQKVDFSEFGENWRLGEPDGL